MPAGYGCDACGVFIPLPTGDQLLWQIARHCSSTTGPFGPQVDTQSFFFCSLRCLGVWTAARPEFHPAPTGDTAR
jgi:hypothetical protein